MHPGRGVCISHLCVPVHHLILLDHLPADLAAVVHDGVHLRPGAELPLPVRNGGEGCNDEEGAMDAHQKYL